MRSLGARAPRGSSSPTPCDNTTPRREPIRDFALVVSELVTNIIEHGDGTIMVIYLDVADPGWWEVEVVGGSSAASPSSLLQPATWSVAGADAISGRGLGIVRHLMDDVVTGITTGQVSIRCRLRRAPDAT